MSKIVIFGRPLVVIGLALVVGLVAACSSADTKPPNLTATAGGVTASPVADMGGGGIIPTAISTAPPVGTVVASEFRDFARLLDGALQRGDIGFFRQRAHTEHVVCGPDDVQRTAANPAACERAGQEYEGLNLVYWRSDLAARFRVEAVLMMIESLWTAAVPSASDKFGGSQPRVYALGGPEHSAVVTAIITRPDMPAAGPKRVVLVLHWRSVGSEWRLFRVDNAFVLGEDFLEPTDAGRRATGTWERFVH